MKIGDIFESDDLTEAKPLDAAARKAMASGQAALSARDEERKNNYGKDKHYGPGGWDYGYKEADTVINAKGKEVDAKKSKQTKMQNLKAKQAANRAEYDAGWEKNVQGRKDAKAKLDAKAAELRQKAEQDFQKRSGGNGKQRDSGESQKLAQQTTAELIDNQLKQGKRDHATKNRDGGVIDQGVLPADVENKIKQDYDQETLDAALAQTKDQFNKEGKSIYTTTTDATPDTKPGYGEPAGEYTPRARRPGAVQKPSAENLPPVGDDEDGGLQGGGSMGGRSGGSGIHGGETQSGETQRANQGGRRISSSGQMSDSDARTFVKHVKGMSKAERKWLKDALSSVSESVVIEADDETTNAEYRIRRYAQLRGVDPKAAVRAWRDVGSPTDKGEIAGILKSLGGERIGIMKKGATKFKDRNATATAKKLYNWAIDNGYAKKAVSLIDYVEKNSGIMGKARKFINRMTEDTSSREYSDEFVKQLVINAADIYLSKQEGGSDLVANEASELPVKFTTESSKRRIVTRLLNERACKEDDKYVLSNQEYISLKKFLENLNVSFESAGMLVEKSNGKVFISIKKKTLNEAKISDYFDEPVSAESLKKIISIIDSNNVGDSLSLIKKSIMSKLGSGKVESKTLRSIGDELISLSDKGIDLRGVL